MDAQKSDDTDVDNRYGFVNPIYTYHTHKNDTIALQAYGRQGRTR